MMAQEMLMVIATPMIMVTPMVRKIHTLTATRRLQMLNCLKFQNTITHIPTLILKMELSAQGITKINIKMLLVKKRNLQWRRLIE